MAEFPFDTEPPLLVLSGMLSPSEFGAELNRRRPVINAWMQQELYPITSRHMIEVHSDPGLIVVEMLLRRSAVTNGWIAGLHAQSQNLLAGDDGNRAAWQDSFDRINRRHDARPARPRKGGSK